LMFYLLLIIIYKAMKFLLNKGIKYRDSGLNALGAKIFIATVQKNTHHFFIFRSLLIPLSSHLNYHWTWLSTN
jgi:hypothetical protein